MSESGGTLPQASAWVQAEVIDFISDLHLSPDMPQTQAVFLAYLSNTQAQALVLLGDVFEAWIGDDALSQPFEAECAQALRVFTQQRPLLLMRGNRDFLLGAAFFKAIGAQDLPDPCVLRSPLGQALLTHGDAWCVADTAYQQFRGQVRQTAWQSAFLKKPLPERLAIAQGLRAASQAHQQDPNHSHADVDLSVAARHLLATDCDVLVHGHTHQPGTQLWAAGLQRHVLSDWDLDGHGAPRCEVLRWSVDGWQRLPPSAC